MDDVPKERYLGKHGLYSCQICANRQAQYQVIFGTGDTFLLCTSHTLDAVAKSNVLTKQIHG